MGKVIEGTTAFILGFLGVIFVLSLIHSSHKGPTPVVNSSDYEDGFYDGLSYQNEDSEEMPTIH